MRTRTLTALTLAAALALVACGDDDDDAATESTAAAPATTAAAAPDTTAAARHHGADGRPRRLRRPPSTPTPRRRRRRGRRRSTRRRTSTRRRAHIADAEALRTTIEAYTPAGEAVGGIALSPTDVVVDGDTATITYDVMFAGQPAYQAQEGVVRAGRRRLAGQPRRVLRLHGRRPQPLPVGRPPAAVAVGHATRVAGPAGSASRKAGRMQPAAANASSTAAATSSARAADTRAIAEPPNPPPVIARPERAGSPRRVDGEVQLGARHGEVVAQRAVGRVEQGPDGVEPAVLQRSGDGVHPAHLGQHVAGERPGTVVLERGERRLDVVAGAVGDVAERTAPRGAWPPARTRAGGRRTRRAGGCGRPSCRSPGGPDRGPAGRSGCGPRCRRGSRGAGRGRHATAARPPGPCRRSAPGRRRSRLPRRRPSSAARAAGWSMSTQPDSSAAAERDRADEGGGAGQPGADRHVAVHHDVEPRHVGARAAHRPHRPGDVPRPSLDQRAVQFGDRTGPRWVPVAGRDVEHAVVTPADGAVGPLGESEREAATGVVVDVLADEVDPAGRRPDTVGGAAVPRPERVGGPGHRVGGRDVPLRRRHAAAHSARPASEPTNCSSTSVPNAMQWTRRSPAGHVSGPG